MPIEPLEPEDRIDPIELGLGIALAVIVTPGVIWWIGTAIELITGERPW